MSQNPSTSSLPVSERVRRSSKRKRAEESVELKQSEENVQPIQKSDLEKIVKRRRSSRPPKPIPPNTWFFQITNVNKPIVDAMQVELNEYATTLNDLKERSILENPESKFKNTEDVKISLLPSDRIRVFLSAEDKQENSRGYRKEYQTRDYVIAKRIARDNDPVLIAKRKARDAEPSVKQKKKISTQCRNKTIKLIKQRHPDIYKSEFNEVASKLKEPTQKNFICGTTG